MNSFADVKYVLDTFLLLITGGLVMWMAAGFAMLEAGLVRSKNTTAILTKNIALYSVACIAFYITGYDIFYGEGYALFGLGFLAESAKDGDHSGMSDFFFQVVFVATSASIVSGTVAERIKFWPFIIFTLLLTAVIYPIQGHFTAWGPSNLFGFTENFSDFAGSTIVHSTGGWAALAGTILLGARKGKYVNGRVQAFPGANLPLATIGTFILWFGWFGFNGGSQLALGSIADADAISQVFANTNIAACGGAVMAMILTQLLYKKVDLTMILNGALAGLVSITAGPDYPSMGLALFIGAIGGVLVVFAVPFFDKLKIDDPVGALSVHLVNGIWGTLAVGFFSPNPDHTVIGQLKGIIAVGIFVFAASFIVWYILKKTLGIRLSDEIEAEGGDIGEFGLHAYPEFISSFSTGGTSSLGVPTTSN